MSPELQQALAEVIKSAVSAKDFIIGQIPEVIQQLLMWYGVKSFLFFLCGILLALIIVYLNYRQVVFVKERELWDEPALVLNLLQLFWLFPISFLINIQWLQIWIAPKVWLIEYASKLIK